MRVNFERDNIDQSGSQILKRKKNYKPWTVIYKTYF